MVETVKIDPSDIPFDPIQKANRMLNSKQGLTVDQFKKIIADETSFTETTAEEIVNSYSDKGYIDISGDRIRNLRIKEIKDVTLSQKFDADNEYKQDLDTAEQASYFSDYLIQHRGIKPVEVGNDGDTRIQLWAFQPENGTWRRDSMKKAKRISKKELPRNIFNSSFLRELEINLSSSIPIDFQELGLPRNQIALDNGILDIETLEIREIEESDYVLNRIPVEFEKPEEFVDDYEKLGCPKWGEFLRDAVPEEKQRKKLQEFVGYTLMHWTTRHEKGLMLLGPTDSGKGVFLTTVEYLIGQENVSNHSLQYLANKMWGRQDLATNMSNIRHDLDTDMIAKMGKVKEMISGDPIMAAKKRQDPVKINPVAKQLYSANSPPKRKIEDDAFYNRWLTVLFPNSKPKEEQDKELVEKLTGLTRNTENSHQYEGELPGIFNWALVGLRRLKQNNGNFTGEIASSATQQLWQEYGSTVDNFKKEFLVKEEGAKIPTRAAFEAYKMYAQVDGLETEGHSGFSRQINNDPEIRKGSRKINGEQWSWAEGIEKSDNSKRCFLGLRLKSGAIEELNELTEDKEIF